MDGRRVVEIDGESVPTYTVRVTAPRIDHLGASVSSIVMADRIETRKLDIEASSSGDIRAKIAGGDVSVDANSSGDVHVSGTCDKLDIDANSSADVRADKLTCRRGDLQASSGADIVVRLTDAVTAHANSGGNIVVRGGATPIK